MFKNKVAVVTGGARGIGRTIAYELANKGAKLAVLDLDIDGAKETAELIKAAGNEAIAVRANIAHSSDVERAFREIVEEIGAVDILVNNASITSNMALLVDMNYEAWNQEIAVNLSGAFYCTKQVLSGMMARGWGRIINISSIAGALGGFGQCAYAASKAGIIGLTRTIALEGAKKSVTTNAVVPGVVATDAYNSIPEKLRERILNITAVGKPGEPDDIAHAVMYLASEEAKYVTGTSLVVGGGIDLFKY